MILSTNPSAAIWTMRTKGVTKRDTLGGTQKLTFINESSLIFDDWTISRLDDRRWREEEAGEARKGKKVKK